MSKPWYTAAFGPDYLERYAHRDEAEADASVQSFLEAAPIATGSTVMDLCCGAGRHVASLHRRGMHVIGLDLSADLLEAARERLEPLPDSGSSTCFPVLLRADKRHIPLPDSSLDAVTHFFTAFGYFEKDEENFAVFAGVARVLRPGGWYLFDFFNEARVRSSLDKHGCSQETETLDDGTHVVSTRRLVHETGRIEKHLLFTRDQRPVKEMVESVRLFTPAELRDALDRNGFRVDSEWGNYDGSAFEENRSPRWIALCRTTKEFLDE